jgi:histidinol-phosphate aminotransferase
MTEKPLVKMNSNENYFVDENWMRERVKEALDLIDIRKYPIIYEADAKKVIAKLNGVKPENLVLGNGSDEVIDCTLKSFLKPGDNIVIHSPTFGMYKFYAPFVGCIVKEVSLKPDFNIDKHAMLRAIDPNTKLVIVCSPNNPTGNQFQMEEVREIIEKSRTTVVVDEAYADLARYTVTNLIMKYSNLIVFKTFSKSYGLAGIRIGYGLSNTENIEKIKKAIPPFNVNSVALATVRVLAKHQDYIKEKVEEIRAERENFYHVLSQLNGLKPYTTETNFFLIKVSPEYDAKEIVKRLEQQNIIIRYWGFEPLLNNCIRISLGSKEMNRTVINALRVILKEMKK